MPKIELLCKLLKNRFDIKVGRLLKQQPKDSHKLYSLHAPEAECIAKGKHTRKG
jgi:hypothetical protein